MFKTPSELKEFIIWAKEHKVKRVRVDNIEVEISDLAFIEGLEPLSSQIGPITGQESNQDAAKKEEDEDLYWSANN